MARDRLSIEIKFSPTALTTFEMSFFLFFLLYFIFSELPHIVKWSSLCFYYTDINVFAVINSEVAVCTSAA